MGRYPPKYRLWHQMKRLIEPQISRFCFVRALPDVWQAVR